MSDAYMRDILRIAVAQICQTIGYNATQTTPLELLQDVLHKFLQEVSRDLRRQVEHYNRTEANLHDICLTLNSLNINIHELLDYTSNVEPVPFPYEVPKFPARKTSNLNFLKPGSKEVLTRPVHLFEYLPPTLPPDSADASTAGHHHYHNENSQEKTIVPASALEAVDEVTVSNVYGETMPQTNPVKSEPPLRNCIAMPIASGSADKEYGSFLRTSSSHLTLDDEGRPTREISSVVMTTGGFISPAIEGRLPDAIIPDLFEKFVALDAQPARPKSRISPDSKVVALKTEPNHEFSGIEAKTEGVSKKSISTPEADVRDAKNTRDEGDGMSNDLPSDIAKKRASGQTTKAPKAASRLLKKAKKSTALQNKLSRVDQANNFAGLNLNLLDTHSKAAKRKCKKMLQKLSKSAKNVAPDALTGLDGKLKGLIDPVILTSMPDGPARAQLEKLIKKQAKHKQKLLKQQMAAHSQNIQKQQMSLAAPEGDASNKTMKQQQLVLKDEGDIGGATVSLLPNTASNALHDVLESQAVRGTKSSCTSMHGNNEVKSDVIDGAASVGFESKPSLEVKLSTEPDRSKLDIFKKISKQKAFKAVSPNVLAPIFNSAESKLINLPTGTTITPAPPIVGHVCPPDRNEFMNLNEIGDRGNNNMGLVGLSATNAQDVSLVNKPKKRGRKPGSKNHAKPPAMMAHNTVPGAVNSLPVKKPKKLKAVKPPACALNFSATPNMNVEPLNLTNPNQADNTNNYMAMNLPKSFPLPEQAVFPPIPAKQRKERKKAKLKNSVAVLGSVELDKLKTNVGVPTSEEFNSINKKLMRMDTVLQPAPPMAVMPTNLTAVTTMTAGTSSADMLYTLPKQKPLPKASGGRKRAQGMMIPPNIAPPSFMPTGAPPGFPNLPANMLSMLPLYPFAPRPGLIPTPGLFPPPPGMTGFPSNLTNPAPIGANMLLPGFLTFPNLKTPSSSTARMSMPVDNYRRDGKHNFVESSLQPGDYNYCNVAPLVPDSMKLTSSDSKLEKPPAMPVERNSKMRQSMLLSEAVVNDNINGTEVRSASDGGLPLKSSELSTALKSSNRTADMPVNTNQPHIFKAGIAGNADEPIEVSDDSADEAPTNVAKLGPTLVKPQATAPAVPHVQLNDIFMPNESSLGTFEKDASIKDVKKMKKLNKLSKKSSGLVDTTAPSADVYGVNDVVCSSAGVGKLAGGADLIPLARTGLAYSAKTIPSSSLTAAATSAFMLHKKEFVPPSNVFENPVPASTAAAAAAATSFDLQKKRKEHKKLKKIKEGKIKKKKDKKDKSKSKERAERHIHKAEKIPKDKDSDKYKEKELMKKLKKEKKKEEKNRMFLNTMSTPSALLQHVSHTSSEGGFYDAASGEKTAAPLTAPLDISTSTGALPANTTLVPKLTLKLASCQSPPADDATQQNKLVQQSSVTPNSDRAGREPSPELARISPLVTRPPKQKLNPNDSIISHGSAAGPSTATNITNTESLVDSTKNSTTVTGNSNLQTHGLIPPPSPWLTGDTLTASSVLLPQQLMRNTKTLHEHQLAATTETAAAHTTERTSVSVRIGGNIDRQSPPVTLITETSRPSSYIDAEGNRVWICPACGKVDDGSAMIGCDGCDAWYHWVCVGIFVAPKDNEDWFCRVCITRRKGVNNPDKKRKRHRRK